MVKLMNFNGESVGVKMKIGPYNACVYYAFFQELFPHYDDRGFKILIQKPRVLIRIRHGKIKEILHADTSYTDVEQTSKIPEVYQAVKTVSDQLESLYRVDFGNGFVLEYDHKRNHSEVHGNWDKRVGGIYGETLNHRGFTFCYVVGKTDSSHRPLIVRVSYKSDSRQEVCRAFNNLHSELKTLDASRFSVYQMHTRNSSPALRRLVRRVASGETPKIPEVVKSIYAVGKSCAKMVKQGDGIVIIGEGKKSATVISGGVIDGMIVQQYIPNYTTCNLLYSYMNRLLFTIGFFYDKKKQEYSVRWCDVDVAFDDILCRRPKSNISPFCVSSEEWPKFLLNHRKILADKMNDPVLHELMEMSDDEIQAMASLI
ncbi:MAG: hypothetical protein D6698_15170 [Gammaproteobacteria bacterium]|nr:MAG: hypothetical protein D6698_15170 [Gammaproteobacteria bacterium]